MRVAVKGVRRGSAPFRFDFEGRAIEAWPGETIAAALVASGIWGFRETRNGALRGPYCGMGVCGECLVSVDGQARRACLEPVRPGLQVARHRQHAAPSGAIEGGAAWGERACDILVVGAGPAGLSAASIAARAGLDVVVVDERAKAGGQYFKQPAEGFAVDEGALDAQFREGRALFRAAEAAGAAFLSGATVWGAFSPGEIAAATQTQTIMLRPKRLVLAPGAYERALPLPGWTLPGVVTTGAAQTLLRAYQTAPGRRVLVAGNGPLNLQVARELTDAGVAVAAVAELAGRPGIGSLAGLAAMAWSAPGLVREGLRHLAALRRAGVPVCYGHGLVAVEGADRAEAAVIARIGRDGRPVPGTERRFAVDAVLTGYGFLPQSEISRALGCRHRFDEGSGALVVERADDGRTSVPEVFVVGDAGGLGGARVALAQGVLAGVAAAGDLGAERPRALEREVAEAKSMLARHRRFQTALWSLYAAPSITHQLAAADTLICRCEEVDRQAIEAVLAQDVSALGAIKRVCRAGMGRCQGRYCVSILARMAAGGSAGELAEDAFFAPRTPFKPVPLACLADQADFEH